MDYKKLFEDLKSGEFDPTKWSIVVDNDGGYWRYTGDDAPVDENGYIDDDFTEPLEDAMAEKYGKPGGYSDIVDVLNAVGFQAEWC